MNPIQKQLEAECDQAARDFLAMTGWTSPKSKVESYVKELRSGSRLSTSAMEWLLRQTTKLPVSMEPARRLHDLVQAVEAARARRTVESLSTGK